MAQAPNPPLNNQQWRFVEEYMQDPSNATAAAKRAGYTLNSASQAACHLMADQRVKKAIADSEAARAKSIGISSERVLQELAAIAFANPSHVITKDDDGTEKIDLHSLASDKTASTEVNISTVTSASGRKLKTVSVKTVKPADRIAALEKLGKHLGMFKDQIEVTATLSLQQLIEASMDGSKVEFQLPEIIQDDSIGQPLPEEIENFS